MRVRSSARAWCRCALASDGGGSIRIPAAACGVVGLKPSRGRVPWGLHLKEPLLGWAVQFAMTRTVRDAAALLDLLGGPTLGDSEGVPRPPIPFAQTFATPPGPLRIAWWAHPWSGHEPDPVVVDATAATAALLESLGHHVEAATPVFAWETYLQAMTDVWAATNAHTIDGFAGALGREVSAETVEGPTLAMVEYGRSVSATQLLTAIDVETSLTYLMTEFFSRYDILLTPTLGAQLPAVRQLRPPRPHVIPRHVLGVVPMGVLPPGLQLHRPARHQPPPPPVPRRPAHRHAARGRPRARRPAAQPGGDPRRGTAVGRAPAAGLRRLTLAGTHVRA